MDYTLSRSPIIYGCSQLSLTTLHSSSKAIAFPSCGAVSVESFSNCQGRGFALWIVITIIWMFMQKLFLPRGETITTSTITEWYTASFCILNTSITKLPNKSEKHTHSLGTIFLNLNSYWLVSTSIFSLFKLISTNHWILLFIHLFIQQKL